MTRMVEERKYREDHGRPTRPLFLNMVEVTFRTNNFADEYHPSLQKLVDGIVAGERTTDLTFNEIEQIEQIEEDTSLLMQPWERARWIAENIACLWAATNLVGWGKGYRSDDGYDYLTTALDTARFLTNIDLSEVDFRAWWDYTPESGMVNTAPESHEYIGEGASDGEIRFMLFPERWEV